MRLVVSSDWHGDWSTLGVSRFEEVERAVWQSVNHAIDKRADAYLFAGDLADPDGGGATLRAIGLAVSAASALASRGIQSVWIAGNHDVCEDGTGETVLSPLAAMAEHSKYVYVAEDACVRSIYGADHRSVDVLCLPFTPSSRGEDAAEQAKRFAGTRRHEEFIVLAHLSVPGIQPGEETTEMPRGREVTFPFAETKAAAYRINGHYHRQQTFDPGDGGMPILVPGSLARLSFGEQEHTPVFLMLDV